MNSVERVKLALRGGRPDRVPVVEFIIDPRIWRQATPHARDAADAMDRLGLDAVSCGARFAKVVDEPDGTWRDEWGVTYRDGPEAVPHPVCGPITSMSDLKRYTPPDPDAPQRLGDLTDLVRRYKGRRAIFFHQRAEWMWAAYLRGMDNLLADLLVEPTFAGALMDMVLEVDLAIARRAVRAGAEVILLGDDYAWNGGPMMSPSLFRAHLLPRLKRMIDTIHEEGALVVKHSDGNLYPILEDLANSGADALNPIEPSAGMDLATTKARVAGRSALMGNVDCGHLLPYGTVEDVRGAVRQCIRDAAEGGGYLLSSSNSIHSSCRAENFAAMIRAAQEFGAYPTP